MFIEHPLSGRHWCNRRCKMSKTWFLFSNCSFIAFPVVMYGCESWTVKKAEKKKESWALKNWYFWTVVSEKTLGSPLDCKEIQPVHPKGGQSWVFIGKTDAETPILWPPHAKSWLIEKTLMLGGIGGRRRRGWWHHLLDGHEFEWTLGVGDGQEGLACCDSWGHKELDTTGRLNWTELTSMDGLIWLPVSE